MRHYLAWTSSSSWTYFSVAGTRALARSSIENAMQVSAVICIPSETLHGPTIMPSIIQAQIIMPPPPCWHLKVWSHYGQWCEWAQKTLPSGWSYSHILVPSPCPCSNWTLAGTPNIEYKSLPTSPNGVFSFLHFIENVDLRRHFLSVQLIIYICTNYNSKS